MVVVPGVHSTDTPSTVQNTLRRRGLHSSPSWSMAPSASAMAVKKLGVALKASLEKLFGPTLHLSAGTIELMFPSAYERLHTGFFRTKITSWMAAQEEDFRWGALLLLHPHAVLGSVGPCLVV